jgi:hypothetical protein
MNNVAIQQSTTERNCVSCSNPIGAKRLTAKPNAIHCIECQNQHDVMATEAPRRNAPRHHAVVGFRAISDEQVVGRRRRNNLVTYGLGSVIKEHQYA